MNNNMSRENLSVSQLLWRSITHNGWLKAMSLVFAFVLFLIVRTQQVREYTRMAKLRIVTAPNVLVIGSQERFVDVTVRMPETLFSRQPTDEELAGELDVSQEKVGKIRVRLSRENFQHLDKRFGLVVHDPWMEIDLDTELRKRVSVRAVLQGLPREGLAIERVSVTPEEVEVIGARRVVSRIDTLSTSAINIENIDKNFTSLTTIVLDEYSSLKVREEKVNVQVIVGPKKVIRAFHAVPVEVNIGGRIELRPTHIEVEIQGQKDILEGLKPSDVRAFLDTEGLSEGWQEKKVKLKIPAGTSLVRVVPDTVSVQVLR